MVTTEVSQLSSECNAWREALRSYRDEFGQFKNRLQDVAARQTKRDLLQEVEHLHNQFHIQLINIHDLKQAIKFHDRIIAKDQEHVSEEALANHENLFDDYQTLEHTLQNLRDEFDQFIARAS